VRNLIPLASLTSPHVLLLSKAGPHTSID